VEAQIRNGTPRRDDGDGAVRQETFPHPHTALASSRAALLPKEKGPEDAQRKLDGFAQLVSRRGRYPGMPPLLRHMTYRARALRRAATPAETVLWERVRARRLDGFKFRRQQPLGRYIVDFFCEQAALVIEADGRQHYPAPPQDVQRDRMLTTAGILVLRFSNDQITGCTDQVLHAIRLALRQRCPRGPQ